MNLLFSSVLHFFVVVENIHNRKKNLEKFIMQWILDGNGRGIARDLKKNIFIFMTKNGNTVWTILKAEMYKVGTIYKVGTYQLFKLSKLCYHLLSRFENENIFFFISLAIPRPSRSGIHWPINFSKKNWWFCIFSNKKSAKLKRRERSFQLCK